MAEQTMKHRLVDFTGLEVENEEERKCYEEAYNSFKLKISELEKYKEIDYKFTQCSKESCRMVLTDKDISYIYDQEWVQQNQEKYSNEKEKVQIMKKNPNKYKIWKCRFCATCNLVERDKLYFAKNKTKEILDSGIKVNEGEEFCQHPILLFLIDNSSSMEAEIFKDNDSSEELAEVIKNQIKETKIYKMIVEDEKKRIEQVNKQLKFNKSEEFESAEFKDHISKYKVLMGLTEIAVNDICQFSKGAKESAEELFDSNKNSSESYDKKIGFMFFNSNIIMQKNIEGKLQKVEVENKQFSSEVSSSNRIKVDFDSFDALFNVGKKNSKDYGTNINKFKFSDLKVENMATPAGQTALGPALAVATGIINNYGPGSCIVVVTDGKGNKGVFSDDGVYRNQIKLMKINLNKSKAGIHLLQLDKKNNNESKSDLYNFFENHCEMINISLDSGERETPIEFLKRKLKSLVDKMVGGKTWTNDILIRTQIPCVEFREQVQKNQLFDRKSQVFFKPAIHSKLIKHSHFKHPFMTQILVYYTELNTNKTSLFMGYMLQKLIKYNEMNEKDKELFQSTETLQNVLNYLAKERQSLDLINTPLSISQKSFRNSISSISMSIDRTRKMEMMKEPPNERKIEKKEFRSKKEEFRYNHIEEAFEEQDKL